MEWKLQRAFAWGYGEIDHTVDELIGQIKETKFASCFWLHLVDSLLNSAETVTNGVCEDSEMILVSFVPCSMPSMRLLDLCMPSSTCPSSATR